MPQARLRSNVRIELSKKKELGFASVIIQHNYFFNQDRVGPLETATGAYHLCNWVVRCNGIPNRSGAVFWCKKMH